MLRVDDQIKQFLNHQVVERGASQNTVKAYAQDLARYLEFLQANQLSVITAETILQHISALRIAHLSEPSIARAVVTIRNFHEFVSSEWEITNPAAEISVPKIPKRLPKALSISEVNALIDACPSEGVGVRDRAIIELLYASGARISELVALTLEDISEIKVAEEETMTVKVRGKGGKERYIPIGSFAQRALTQYLVRVRPTLVKSSRERALFLNSFGGQLTRQSGWNIVKLAAKRSGNSEKVSPHSLRHSFATHLIDGGADIRVVQELLGHASVTTTQIYTLITIDKLRESYAVAHPRSR